MTIRAIIFDLSDTLVVGLTGIGPRLETMLKSPAAEIPALFRDDAMLDFLLSDCTEDEYLTRLKAIHGWAVDIEAIKPVIREHFRTAIPGMAEIVAELARSYPLYLLSDQGREWARYIESVHPFMSLFTRCFYSFDLHTRKTDPETFAEVVRQIGVPPAECLMIDDRLKFLDAAREAGLQTILFEGSDSLRERLAQRGIAPYNLARTPVERSIDEWPSETYQLGELLYVVEKSSMALCRVVKVAPCKEIPGGTNYTLEIIEEPYDDDYKFFKVLAYLNPFLLFYNRFTACIGPIYSPYGAHWYRPEWFEHFYGDYHVKMQRWSWACAIILLVGVAMIIACCLAGAFLIFKK